MTKELYSQRDEQIHILEYYKNKPVGKFIDIGAYDVFKFSNTRALYEKGWKGIFVEPSPENFYSISKHYEKDDEIIVLRLAIGDKTEEIDFYSCQDAVSTSDIDHMKKWGDAGVPYTKIKVPQLDVVTFMHDYGVDCNFLSIDTESTNMIVFNAMPEWVWKQISMLCIEHDNHQEEIEDKLKPFGFLPLYQSAENIILAK